MPSLNIERFKRRVWVDSLRDWPRRLRLNAASAKLAPALFAAHCELARERGTWEGLTTVQRQRWIDMAATTLDVGEFTARVLRNAPR